MRSHPTERCAAACVSRRRCRSAPRISRRCWRELAGRHPELEIQASYSDRKVDLLTEGFDAAIRLGHARRFEPRRATHRAVRRQAGREPGAISRSTARRARRRNLLAHAAVNRVNDEWPLLHDGQTITRASARAVHRRQRRGAGARGARGARHRDAAELPGRASRSRAARWCAVMPDYPMPEAGVYVVRPPGGSAPCKVRVLIDIMVETFGNSRARSRGQPVPEINGSGADSPAREHLPPASFSSPTMPAMSWRPSSR